MVWRAYLDGAEVATDIRPVAVVGSDGGLYISAGTGMEPGSFWSDLIDDIKIYDESPTPDGIPEIVH